jgi:hypothetical protein
MMMGTPQADLTGVDMAGVFAVDWVPILGWFGGTPADGANGDPENPSSACLAEPRGLGFNGSGLEERASPTPMKAPRRQSPISRQRGRGIGKANDGVSRRRAARQDVSDQA